MGRIVEGTRSASSSGNSNVPCTDGLFVDFFFRRRFALENLEMIQPPMVCIPR
jgi:hypothetical protein